MPNCRNCGAHVSDRAVRVLYPEGVTEPNGCVNCQVYIDGSYVEAKSKGNVSGSDHPEQPDPRD